jgi:hypothetical protein
LKQPPFACAATDTLGEAAPAKARIAESSDVPTGGLTEGLEWRR